VFNEVLDLSGIYLYTFGHKTQIQIALF